MPNNLIGKKELLKGRRERKKFIILIVFCIFLGFSIDYIFGQSISEKEKEIKIGIASMMTPSDTMKYYLKLVEYLSKKVNRKAIMIQRKTYDEMDILLKKGEVDIGFICSGAYIRDKKEFGIELLAAEQHKKEAPYYNSYIIVHKESNIYKIKDLKGKTFAFTDPKSNTGYLYPMYRLAEMKINPSNFFRKVYFTYSHNKSIHLVATKIVDGASVDSIVYDYLIEKHKPYAKLMRIIEVSPKFASPPVVASTKLNPELKNRLKEALLHMHLDKEGASILKELHIVKFVAIEDKDYKNIEKMAEIIDKSFNAIKLFEINKKIIRFGLLPNANARILFQSYSPFLDYLREKTNYEYDLIIRPTYNDILLDIGNEIIDLAFLDPLTYLEAKKKYNVKCLLKPLSKRGIPYYYSYIIARKNSSINSLEEFKGRSFAFTSIKSAEGNLIPRLMLAQAGIHLSELRNYKNFNTGKSAVKSVISGDYDGAAVKDSIIERYLKGNIKIIAKSEKIPTGPLVYRNGLDPDVLNKIKKVLLELNYKHPKDKIIMDKWNPDIRYGFMEAEDKDYEEIRQQINNIPKKCGLGCHPKISF